MGNGGGGGWRLEQYKPCVAMVLVQCFYALVDVALKTASSLGMRPIIFVAYRQGIAAVTLLLASVATGGWRLRHMALGARAFGLVFMASLTSATGQYFYLEGLLLASPSMARATTNMAPGITFAIAALIGLEKVELRSLRSIAKIIGTIVCLGGAMLMAFFKGPKLISTLQQNFSVLLLSASEDWVRGGIYLIGNAICVSIWYILQVPVCKSYLDPLSLATWMCLLATLQSAVLACFLVPNYLEAWKLTSLWELPCILYGGVFASGANFFLQSWCISVKGPLYNAIFTPLSAVITAILSTIFLQEQLHVGSILGAITIIAGLYAVLWGKADDQKIESLTIHSNDSKKLITPRSTDVEVDCETNLTEQLLPTNTYVDP